MQTVRRRITEILKTNGTATVAELAEQLGMAEVSVRHHLDILVGEDLVLVAGVRRREGAGRPSQVYELTPEAAKLFPRRYDILADDMLAELKTLLPAQEIRNLLLRLAEKTSRGAPLALPGQTTAERLDQVTRFLCDMGYTAKWEARDGRYELHTCNCPYTSVADHHPELCMMDQAMIERLLPEAIRIESRVLDSSAGCTYAIALSEESNAKAAGRPGLS